MDKLDKMIAPMIQNIEANVESLQERVISTFRKHKVSEYHLHSSTGYGYDDIGRETLERVFADLFGAELALIRPNIIAGTHAIASCLYGVLRPGDEFIYLTGKPYDTLHPIIGEKQDGSGSLRDLNIHYKEIPLTAGNEIDWNGFLRVLSPQTKMVCIQRSRGYSNRPSFSVSHIKQMIQQVKEIRADLVIFVDNCYGEFVELQEPTHVGADIIAGSMIKNPGGGLAKSGGYIVGKDQWVKKAAARLVAPGIGVEGGATYGYLRDYFQGLFMAPHIVGEALKGAVYTAALTKELGFDTNPLWNESRTDIIQQINLKTPERLIAFCQGIQAASPIDSHVLPTPSNMPGYKDPVIMAAGTFVQGASIELSADAPLRYPYTVFLQGGLTYAHVRIAVKTALQTMKEKVII